MIEIKKIAVPVDFTDVAPFVARYAKDFAKSLNAEVVLIYILEDLSAYEGLYVDAKTLTGLEAKLREGARASMEEFVKEHFADYDRVRTVIEKGDVVEGIIEVAKKEGADLIIIGTHGRKGLDRILFGSVAEGVIKNSPIPVLSLNPYRMQKS